jgi:hypothetical protein
LLTKGKQGGKQTGQKQEEVAETDIHSGKLSGHKPKGNFSYSQHRDETTVMLYFYSGIHEKEAAITGMTASFRSLYCVTERSVSEQ